MSIPCYALNGTAEPSNVLPCNVTALENNQHSACCGASDLCLTNGLCKNPTDEEKGSNFYYRVGCTDPTFQDPACPKYCANKELPGRINAIVFNCLKDRSWCCTLPNPRITTINTDCCNQDNLTFELDNPVIYATAKLSSITFSSTASRSVATGNTTTTSGISGNTPPQSDSGSSTALKIGLAVGLSSGLVTIALLVTLLLMLKRRNRQKKELDEKTPESPPPSLGHNGDEKVELLADDAPGEIQSGRNDTELPGHSARYEMQSGRLEPELAAQSAPAELMGTPGLHELPVDANVRRENSATSTGTA